MSKGIDVSHHQGAIDWVKVKAGGVEFAIIRTGLSRTEDAQFRANIQGAIKAGLPVGIYHFSYALTAADAAGEAKYCCSLLKPYKVDLPVYYDLEDDSETYGAKKGAVYTPKLRTDMALAFCGAVKAAGYVPGIYTNPNYILYRYGWDKLKGYPLWLAQWPQGIGKRLAYTDVPETSVSTKYGKPAIWQFGLGRIPGINADVDLNYGYMALPAKASPPQSPTTAVAPFSAGDRVTVANTTIAAGVKRGQLYGGAGSFVVYHNTYDVISVSGQRVVIGIGKTVTAAVDAGDLKRV